MKNIILKENEIIFSRNGETVRLSGCENNSIRFQAFPDGKIIEEN